MSIDTKDREYITGILTGVAMMTCGWEIRTCADHFNNIQLVQENTMSRFNESGAGSDHVEWDGKFLLDDETCNACGGTGTCAGTDTSPSTNCPKCAGRGKIVPPALVCSARLP